MGQEGNGEGDGADHPVAQQRVTAQDRARRLRLLGRIGEALGRPIEDFFAPADEVTPDPGPGKDEPSED